ncbi:hypothetical protein [Pantoea sp.]|uniref:hypothetical protein n=1 Tax=Pantoea sp. TaxID=69393 RepID=UPI0028B13601|nr:hypothetical protein [Pantoea sp.]
MIIFGIPLDKILIPAITALTIGVATLIHNYQARKKGLPNERLSILKDIKSIDIDDLKARYVTNAIDNKIKENTIYELSKIKNTINGERYLKITASNKHLTKRGETYLRSNIDYFKDSAELEKDKEGKTTNAEITKFEVNKWRLIRLAVFNTIIISSGIYLLFPTDYNLVDGIAAELNPSIGNSSHIIAIFSFLAFIIWAGISLAIFYLPNIFSLIYIYFYLSDLKPYFKKQEDQDKYETENENENERMRQP